ncbi:MAG: CopG family transcriptional regulator [Streptosporangiaceae bacterium]
MRRVQIHLDEHLDEAAAREASRRGVSKAELIRECLSATVGSGGAAAEADPWDSMIGWRDDEPVDDIDAAVYGPRR